MNDLITNFNEKITFSKINIRYFKLSTSKCHTIPQNRYYQPPFRNKEIEVEKDEKFS